METESQFRKPCCLSRWHTENCKMKEFMSPLIPVKPGENPAPCNANSAPGFARRACTNTGRQVNVWVPAPNAAPNWQYFCHGHALGTHAEFGYTVFSGTDLQHVLQDEWYLVGNVHNARIGDIVVWRNVHQGNRLLADHSALIKTIGQSSNGVKVILSSKNGTNPLLPSVSLAELIKAYGQTYELCRRR